MTEVEEVPEHRCGFELTPEDPRVDWDSDVAEWRSEIEAVSCCREPWRDFEQCIWHTEVEDKPVDELKLARADGPERIDGAYLAGVDAGDELPFQRCLLMFADLTRAQFPSADLREAQFPKADLTGAQFPNAILREAQFPKAHLFRAQFPDADLWRAQFPDAFLTRAQFPDAYLERAQFPDAHLTRAEFEGADARSAYFGATNLQETDLTRTDLRGATLINAHFDQTVFSDTRIDATTDFGDSPDEWGPTCIYETHPEATTPPGDRSHWEAAEWVYRRLQKLHEENALSEEARGFHVRKEEVRRKSQKKKLTEAREQLSEDLADNDLESAYKSFVEMLRRDTRYSVSTLNWHLTRHGESLRQIFVSAGVLILACGLLYPFVGGFESSANDAAYRIPLTEAYRVLSLEGVLTVAHGIYFSIITFTTIGYGDLYPTGIGSKALVGFESLAGAILIALFVFVLGRQVAR